MTTVGVTIPPSLAFLVSNFHSLVTIKLESSNYLLWRIQVENVMEANGFYSYLDGSVSQPSTHLCSTEGVESVNPAYVTWKLIDAQLLSCLTASLSSKTLPYVLGLHHAKDVWLSMAKRYDALTEGNVQDLRTQLFEISKTSTMEDYIDKIKEVSQKLGAAGCPIEDKELVFHTLRGLPKTFNGLKTAIRAIKTRGHEISFDDIVVMLKSEDLQLSQEVSEVNNTTVLVTHNNDKSGIPNQSQPQQAMSQSSENYEYSHSSPQPMTQVNHFMPRMFSYSGRGVNRGRGFRGPRFPSDPCAICGRNNHITQFCYYGSPGSSSWSQNFSQPRWMSSGSGWFSPPQQFRQPNQFFEHPVQQHTWSGVQNQFRPRQFGEVSRSFGGNQSVPPTQAQALFAGYDEGGKSNELQDLTHLTQSQSQPWYFDSGATGHVTNNLQNLSLSQASDGTGGVTVGNGSTLQVTHTGKGPDNQADPLSRSMSQGFIPYPELL